MWEVFSTSFIKSAIDSANKLKLLENDLPLKVDCKEIKARDPRVIIVWKASYRFRISHLKALLILYFMKRIRVLGFFIRRATKMKDIL